MIRVLHVLTALGHGGAEIWLLNLMKPLEARGVRTDFALKAPELGALLHEGEARGGRTYHVPLNVAQVSYVRELARIATEERYDVIHIHEFVYSGLGVLAAKLAKKPCVLTYHHYVYDPHTPLTRRPGIRQVREVYGRLSVKFAVANADAVTALSETVMGRVVPGYETNPRCRLLRLSAECRPPADRSERVRVRRELGVEDDAPLVIHAGRFIEQKNHVGLLRVFRKVLRERPDARLIALGRGPLRDEIMASARDLIAAGAVKFPGARDDVPTLMAASDVCLFPSLREGFGLVALEANACALPVVATRVPGLTEAVVENSTALLHDLRDEAGMARSVVRLLDDRQLAAKLGGQGQERAAKMYSHDASAELLLDLYSGLVR